MAMALDQHTQAEVRKVAIAEGATFDQLELVVQALHDAAREPLVEVVEDDVPPAAQGAHELGQARHTAGLDLGYPRRQARLCRGAIWRRLADRAEGFLELVQP